MMNGRSTSQRSKSQYSNVHQKNQEPTKHNHHRWLSNCLFYAIFAMGTVSLVGMELFIRHSKLVTQVGPRHDYVMAQIGGNTARQLQEAHSTIRIEKGDTQNLRYPTKKTHKSMYHSTMKFAKAPNSARLHATKPWSLDPLFYVNNGISGKISKPRVMYVDPSLKRNNIPSVYHEKVPDLNVIDTHESDSMIEDSECVPMKEWQTAYYPTCNELHQTDVIQQSHPNLGGNMQLFGTNGYWRNAWKVDYHCKERNSTHTGECNETVVLKTLKFQHNFEDANYEHDRIDAMAMERLTSSPHVINIFGACGNSVVTEFADGERVGTLADSKKRVPLERLKIARDIASGLADVHSIDGDEQATFVHFDVNLANVVSVGGRLKLNDFNIGVMQRTNVTSGKPCGFSANYDNPQWRSPEEANGSYNLTEKVDVFSLGHIFFRLICLHEPWHKLEPGYQPGDEIRKQYVKDQVKKGVLPTIPDEIAKTKDAEVMLIREAMLACYTYDPEKRPSARSIANFLERGLVELSGFERRPGKDHWGSFRLGKKKKM